MTDSYPRPGKDIATVAEHMKLFRWAGAAESVFDNTYALTGTSLRVTANGTTNVTVSAGQGEVPGIAYEQTADVQLAVPTNAGNASARHDLVVMRLTFDGDNTAIAPAYKTGGTVAPNPTRTMSTVWEIRLAEVVVPAGAATVPSGNVFNRRVLTPAPSFVGDGSYRPFPFGGGQFAIEPESVAVSLPGTGQWTQLYPVSGGVYTPIGTPGAGNNKFVTGWRNYNEAAGVSGFANAAYHSGPGDLVTLQGAIQATSLKAGGDRIFTLAPGSRPTSERVFNQRGGPINIDETGAVMTGLSAETGDHIFLDGISFRGI